MVMESRKGPGGAIGDVEVLADTSRAGFTGQKPPEECRGSLTGGETQNVVGVLVFQSVFDFFLAPEAGLLRVM